MYSLSLKSVRNKQASFADLLTYAACVDDGIIVCKSGAFIAAWEVFGLDESSTSEEQKNLLSHRINETIKGLGNGWALYADSIRLPMPEYYERSGQYFDGDVLQALDDERRTFFTSLGALYTTVTIYGFVWLPPKLVERRFTELMFDDDNPKPSKHSTTRHLIEHFKTQCRVIESGLQAAMKVTRLKTESQLTENGKPVVFDNLLRWLNLCISGNNHPIRLPSNPIYLNALLSRDFTPGVIAKVGDKFIQVIAVEGFPGESFPGMLNGLSQVNSQIRWSTRFIFLDNHEAIARLEKYRKYWKQKVRGFFDQLFNTSSGIVDEFAAKMVAEADAAVSEINSGMVSSGFYNGQVVLMNADRERLEEESIYIQKFIEAQGFIARIETINTTDAYLGSLPGHVDENLKRPLINTLNLADMLPSLNIWTGSYTSKNPLLPKNSQSIMQCITGSSSVFYMNTNPIDGLGHGIAVGRSRGGKTTWVIMLATQFRKYLNSQVFLFDSGMSCYGITKAIKDSRHYTIVGETNTLAFAPLSRLDTKRRRIKAVDWVETALRLNNLEIKASLHNEIEAAINRMQALGNRSISDFIILIQNNEVREVMKQYSLAGEMGSMFDASEDDISLSRFVTFEIRELMKLQSKYVIPALQYLFNCIEERLDINKPTLIVLDEAWLVFKNEYFRERLVEWLKTLAKLNCCVVLATQQLGDAIRSGVADVVFGSVGFKIFVPDSEANSITNKPLYQAAGLNDQEIELLSLAVAKKQYLYVCDEGVQLFDMEVGPLALSFISNMDVEKIDGYVNKYGEDWANEWVKQFGLSINNEVKHDV